MMFAADLCLREPARRDARQCHDGPVKKRTPSSFAEIVDDVKQAPQQHEGEPRGTWSKLTDPTGRSWREIEAQISPERARELVSSGAELAWDDCGSRGYAAPIEWISREEAAALAVGGTPLLRNNKRHRAELSAWTSDDGSWLVLASMTVKWGRSLA